MTEFTPMYKRDNAGNLVAWCGAPIIPSGCPGRVTAEVARRFGGDWLARPPAGWLWRLRNGRYVAEQPHYPNRGAPDPEKRHKPRRGKRFGYCLVDLQHDCG